MGLSNNTANGAWVQASPSSLLWCASCCAVDATSESLSDSGNGALTARSSPCCTPRTISNPTIVPRELRESSTWTAQLRKGEGGVLGMEVTDCDTALLVEQVHAEGAAIAFNSEEPHLAIAAGDYIIAVNGVRGAAESMLDEAKRSSGLELQLVRATPFTAKVEKGSGSLGARFSVLEHAVVLQEILEGPIQDWNFRNPDWPIKADDHIIGVGVAKQAPEDILKALQEEDAPELIVLPLADPQPLTAVADLGPKEPKMFFKPFG